MKTINEILGENLKRVRLLNGFTQEQLAERAGVSVFTVQAYEKGRRWPELPRLDLISAVLGVSTASLFQSKDPSPLSNEEILNHLASNLGYEIKKK